MSETKSSPRHADRLSGLDLVRARAYCRRLMRDVHQAEDVVQEGLLRMMERAPIDLPGDALQRYFMRSLTHIALNVLDRRHRRDQALLAEPVDLHPLDRGGGLSREHIHQRVEDALGTLAPRARAAVLLREREGLSFREVAEILGLSEAGAATTVYRALRSLKSMLLDLSEEAEA